MQSRLLLLLLMHLDLEHESSQSSLAAQLASLLVVSPLLVVLVDLSVLWWLLSVTVQKCLSLFGQSFYHDLWGQLYV